MSYNDLAKTRTDRSKPGPQPSGSIMDDVAPVPRSVTAAALLAARTGQPLPANIRPVVDKT